MMTRVKLGMAVALGLGLGLGGTASAQFNNALQESVIALNDALGFVIGSTGNQKPGGNEENPCPGAVEDGDEDIYDFGQDGVPDYAQMALVEAMFNEGHSATVAGLNNMTNGLKNVIIAVPPGTLDPETCLEVVPGVPICGAALESIVNGFNVTLPQLLETLIGELSLIDLPEGVGETPEARAILFDQAIDALCLWGVIDNPGNLLKTACVDPLIGVLVGILTNLYDVNLANLNSVVDGSVVLPDNDTILDKWLQASGGKTLATDDPGFLDDVDTFVNLVLAAQQGGDGDGDGDGDGGSGNFTNFPASPPGTPVAGALGLALLAAGIGAAAARRIRR